MSVAAPPTSQRPNHVGTRFEAGGVREVAGTAATADERRLTQREIENLRVIVGFCVAVVVVVVDGIISSAGVVRICSSRECFGVWWCGSRTHAKQN